MKRVYSSMIAAVAVGMFSVTAGAQPSATEQQQQPERSGAVLMQKGFIKKGNEVFRVERITKGTKVEGVQIDDQGNILKDGKPLELKEGQMVTPQGEITTSPLEKSGQ